MDKEVKNIGIAVRIARFILVSALLCVWMSVAYSLYGGKLAEILVKMENANNDMDNMIWLYKHIVNIIPFIVVAILQAVAYIPDRDKRIACKERKWQMLIVFLSIYLVLLRGVMNGQGLPALGDNALWFGTQIIPIIILTMYYSVRQGALDEPEEIHPDEMVKEKAQSL